MVKIKIKKAKKAKKVKEANFKRHKPKNLKEALKSKLTKKQQEVMFRSYDVLGNIAIVDIPEALEKQEKLIAETLIEMNKNVHTVVKKVGIHSGVYRRQKLRIIAGKRTKVATYKENGVTLKFDVEKVYFSSRSATERKRIMGLVKPGEEVLVMFSGCGPFVCAIAKNTEAKVVYGVEMNKIAHEFALENAKLNKLNNVSLFLGDVREIVPKLGKKFDRVLMPLPRTGEEFLDVAIAAVKKKGVIHYYAFLGEDEFDVARTAVKKVCKEAGVKCKILDLVKCGQFSPRVFRISVDFQVL